MSFTSDYAAAATPDLLTVFGEQVVYQPVGGEPRRITAIVEDEPAPVDDGQSHRTRRAACLVSCLESDTTGIQDPRLRDALRRAGEDSAEPRWSFDTTVRRGGGMITCRFVRRSIDRQGELTPSDL
ncbi:MAG: hypothetical protein IPM64_18025 [Phycisphaerales bacterium]|nr:hypothetical protein [Phycisphaerales bacterium]